MNRYKSEKSSQIADAYDSYKKERFREGMLIFEGYHFEPDDVYPSFLYAVLCILNLDFKKADQALSRIRMYEPFYKPYLELEAFLFLKSTREKDEAVVKYLALHNSFPDDKLYLKIIRDLRSCKDFDKLQKDVRLKDFVRIPKPDKVRKKSKIRVKPILKIASVFGVIISVVLISLLVFSKFDKIEQAVFKERSESEIDFITLNSDKYNLIDKISSEKKKFFYYSDSDIANDFKRAKVFTKEEKYNDALLIINQILNSNANLQVKEKAEFLKKFISEVPDREGGVPEYDKISEKPYLYIGCVFEFSGRVANLKKKNGKYMFTLLVDYMDEGNFKSIAQVYSEVENKDIVNRKDIKFNGKIVNSFNSGELYIEMLD